MELLTAVAVVAVVAALAIGAWFGFKEWVAEVDKAAEKNYQDALADMALETQEFKADILEQERAKEPVVEAAPVQPTLTLYSSNRARRTEAIDLTNITPIDRQDSSSGKLLKGNRLYKLARIPFTASVEKDAGSNQRILYLCDAAGKVYDWCSAAPGSDHSKIMFTPDMFEGNPYIYSASTTDRTNAQYSRIEE